ncbi:hypothetical protein [Streptomyces sp. MAR4 CNX-425]|uniref:hypothetical protein n=1 Tax=Streptomyces sp. MAR4 CNX-425 TaxID=3406343 RepID=UPI003B509826
MSAVTQRRRPALVGGIGGVVLLAGAGILALLLPGAVQEGRDYDAAPRCPAPQPEPECRWQGPVTVTDKEYRSGRPGSYHLQLTRGGRAPQWVKMKEGGFGGGDVYEAVDPGDTAAATYWRGGVREVAFGELRQRTEDHPALAYRLPYGGGLALLSVGACLLSAYRHVRRFAGRPPVRNDWRVSIPVASCVLFGVASLVISMYVTDSLTSALAGSAAAGAVILAVALPRAAVQRRRERRPSPAIPVPPQVPYGEVVVPGKVLGDVPYALRGHTHLVAAPGVLASVPGGRPAGRGKYPKPLPGPRAFLPPTLIPLRVRAPRAEDPAGGPKKCHIIECRDGDRQVFLAVDEQATGQVLGALTSRSPAPMP